MSCPAHRDSIVLLHDGELSDDAAASVRSHLAACVGCRAFFEELEALGRDLTPSTKAAELDEIRFWRKFDADLAVRIARGDGVAWWKRPISIPAPAVIALLLVLVSVGWMAGQYRRHAQEADVRVMRLQAVLRDAAESSVFPASLRELEARETSPVQMVSAIGAQPAATPAVFRPRPAPAKAARSQIRFVDSEGVVQAGDLY